MWIQADLGWDLDLSLPGGMTLQNGDSDDELPGLATLRLTWENACEHIRQSALIAWFLSSSVAATAKYHKPSGFETAGIESPSV